MTRAAIYTRISNDPFGTEAGVERQREDCERYCKRNEFEIVERVVDTDEPASRYRTSRKGKRRKVRPGWAQVMELIENDQVDAVVAYDLDRLTRTPRDIEDLIDAVEKRNVKVVSMAGSLDLATGDGRAMARVLTAMAAKSSDDMSRRLRRKFADKALKGESLHSVRPFGYTERLELHPVEAPLVAEAVQRVLEGESLRRTCGWLDSTGITTTRGNTWVTSSLRALLRNPRICGVRSHTIARGKREIVGDGNWPGIVGRATWDRLQIVLDGNIAAGPARQQRSTSTGLYFCALCGTPLVRDTNRGVGVLRCRRTLDRPGACGGVSIDRVRAEAEVAERVFCATDDANLPGTNGKATAGAVDVTLLERRLAELAAMFADGEISRPEWLTARGRIDDQLQAARRTVADTAASSALAPFRGRKGAVRKSWATLDDDRRHAVLVALIDRVTVNRMGEGRRNRFDPDRIEVTWRV